MSHPNPSKRSSFWFGHFEVDLQTEELRKHGVKIKIEGQPLRILGVLLERPGEVVSREELKQRLWGEDTFVDFDHSINAAVKRLRRALDDSPVRPRFIETLSGRGYRFIYPVENGSARAEPPERRRFWRRSYFLPMLGVIVVLSGLLTANVAWLRGRVFVPRTSAPIKSLAVLPLENMTGDPKQDYLVDGIHDELITELAQIGPLKVISRTSVMRYRQSKKPLREIAGELGAEAVLEGAVRREGDHYRITAQLIEVEGDRHLWAHAYDSDLRDVLTLQTVLARAVADEIGVKLTPQNQARLWHPRAVKPAAYKAYLEGRYFWNKRTEQGIRNGIEFFRKAIETDPTHAPSYAGLADSYSLLGAPHYAAAPPREVFPQAKAAASAALHIDETLSEPHTSLAFAQFIFDWDWAAAEREFKRAIELNSSYPTAHHWYALFLMAMDRQGESLAEIRRAAELDPLSLAVNTALGRHYYFARKNGEAIQHFQHVLEMEPQYFVARRLLGKTYLIEGKPEQAIAELQAAVASGGGPAELADLGYAYGVAGKQAEARKMLARLKELKGQRYVSPYSLAIIHAGLGEKDKALAELQAAYAERSGWLVYIGVEPELDSLRSDPRFRNLIRRMNLPQ